MQSPPLRRTACLLLFPFADLLHVIRIHWVWSRLKVQKSYYIIVLFLPHFGHKCSSPSSSILSIDFIFRWRFWSAFGRAHTCKCWRFSPFRWFSAVSAQCKAAQNMSANMTNRTNWIELRQCTTLSSNSHLDHCASMPFGRTSALRRWLDRNHCPVLTELVAPCYAMR